MSGLNHFGHSYDLSFTFGMNSQVQYVTLEMCGTVDMLHVI